MSFDIDYEIVYTIKSGYTSFNKIWQKVKGIGSKQTFSKHLSQLVEDDVIGKRMVKGKPEYFVSDVEHYDKPVLIRDTINQEIKIIKNGKRKISDKDILKKFLPRAKMEVVMLAQENLNLLMPRFESDKEISKSNIKMLNKILKFKIDYLHKRDYQLVIMFDDLLKKSLDEVAQ